MKVQRFLISIRHFSRLWEQPCVLPWVQVLAEVQEAVVLEEARQGLRMSPMPAQLAQMPWLAQGKENHPVARAFLLVPKVEKES